MKWAWQNNSLEMCDWYVMYDSFSSFPFALLLWEGRTDLPEPRSLDDGDAGSEHLQDNVVTQENLKQDAASSGEDGDEQQGVDVLVQHGAVKDVVIEETTCQGTSPAQSSIHNNSHGHWVE